MELLFRVVWYWIFADSATLSLVIVDRLGTAKLITAFSAVLQHEMKEVTKWLGYIVLINLLANRVKGHGRLLEPPSRASMWRFGYGTPIDYNDNQMFCGGMHRQWLINGGKCGVCGDPWDGPREHEAGGKYATGIIGREYEEGQIIDIIVKVTATHKGYFEFRLCPHNNTRTRVTQKCLDQNILRQPSGKTKVYELGYPRNYTIKVVLPSGIFCEECLLQWKWNTGNSWGCNVGGKCCVGCGQQEQFYGCADIAIRPRPGMHYKTTTAHQNIGGGSSSSSHRTVNSFVLLLLSYVHVWVIALYYL